MSNAVTATDVGTRRPGRSDQQVAPAAAPRGARGELAPADSEPPLRSSKTPRRLSLLRALSAILTLIFAVTTAVAGYQAQALADKARKDSAQYVRLSTIKADLLQANAIAADNVALPTPDADAAKSYTDQLAAAAGLIVEAGGADTGSTKSFSNLGSDVARYATLVESARSAKAAGGTNATAGRDQLQQATNLLNQQIVPQLTTLSSATDARLTADARGVPLWWIVIPGFLALAALIATAVQLAVSTHRVLNIGVLLATLAVIGALWLAVGTLSGLSSTSNKAMSEAFASTRAAGAARDDASLAHAAETQRLLGTDANAEASYTAHVAAGDKDVAAVTTNRDAVRSAWTGYKDAASAGQTALAQNRDAAVQKIAGSGADSSATKYRAFMSAADTALTQGQAATSKAFGDVTLTLRLACLGVGLLALFAALASSLGVSSRLREYR